MRIAFAGSPPFSVPFLELLIKRKEVVVVVTAPDRPSGRGMKMSMSPVKKLALDHNIPILQAERLRSEAITAMSAFHADILVCAAYGKIFGPTFLGLFEKGTVNVHPSLLPRFRGAAPIPATLLSEDAITGVSLQKISQDMDCGDIILQSRYEILPEDTTTSLLEVLSMQGVSLLETLLDNFDEYYDNAYVQDEKMAVYCNKITSSFGYVSWQESAARIVSLVKAFNVPYSGVKLLFKDKILKIWEAVLISRDELQDVSAVGRVLGVDEEKGILLQCRRGVIALQTLQLPGKTKLSWQDFLLGTPEIMEYQFESSGCYT